MFGIFKKSDDSPVEETRRQWIDQSFRWLKYSFGEDCIKSKKVLTPTPNDFPIDFDGNEENAYETLEIIAPQMDLDPEEIEIDFYREADTEIKTGRALNSRVFLKQVDHETYSAGQYWGKADDGMYHIGLEVKALRNVEKLIATMAHELSHVKLLGDERITKNNEPLTDLATVIFGLGIFGANSAFHIQNAAYSWSYSRTGYLSQMDWGYALALNSHICGEKSPDWIKFLTLNVKSDFEQSERFIEKNLDKIMKRRE